MKSFRIPNSFQFCAILSQSELYRLLKLLFFLLLFAASPVAVLKAQSIQQKHVPSIVVNTFQLDFPKAADVKWALENGFYKVAFKVNDIDNEAWLDYMGRVQKKKRDIAADELPTAVLNAIHTGFEGFAPYNVERFEERKTVTFKMKLRKLNDKRKVIFTQAGQVVQNNPL